MNFGGVIVSEEKEVGVYILHNKNTDETYAGSGVLEDRKASHFYYLNAGKEGRRNKDGKLIRHPNRKLQAAYNRDSNFDFVAIPTETREEATQAEQSLIDEFHGNPLFLNLSSDARTGVYEHTEETRAKRSKSLKGNQNGLGYKHSEERKEKIRQEMLGRTVSPETRQKLSESKKGKKHSEEHIRNNSLAQTGKSPTAETRLKMSLSQIGRTHSEETKEKIRLSNLGRTMTPEQIEKSRLANIGRKASDETKEKLRIASTGRTLSDEAKAKISQVHKGRIKSSEEIERITQASLHRAKKVCIDGQVFDSVGMAARSLGVDPKTVTNRIANPTFEDWKLAE